MQSISATFWRFRVFCYTLHLQSSILFTCWLIVFLLQSHFISALTVVFVNSKSLSSLKIDDTPVDDPSLKVLVANNSDTLRMLKMSSCPHVSPAGSLSEFMVIEWSLEWIIPLNGPWATPYSRLLIRHSNKCQLCLKKWMEVYRDSLVAKRRG